MERKLGMCWGDPATIKLMADAGFNCYGTGVSSVEGMSRLKEAGEACGATCEFIHAPFDGYDMNNMWLDGMAYYGLFQRIKNCITTASIVGVPMVVAHVSHGWYPPEVNDLGLKRFDELVMYAGEKGVKLAFENVYSVGNLAYFADRYEKLDHVGLCYDAGHEHCFTKTVSWLDIYTNKTFTTHLNDNPGRPGGKEGNTDMHWLPFEGDVDYGDMMKKLNKYGYEGALILEISDRPHGKFKEMTHEEYLAECFKRVKRISEMG